eukprot:3377575-Pyramimonas_sp.AAC.1
MEAGVDNESLRLLLHQVSQLPHGLRLAEVLVNIATGGFWTKQRKVDELKGYRGNAICDRCREHPETPCHRAWGCPKNTGSPAYMASEELVPQALTQVDTAECFWLRGLIPSQWLEVPTAPNEAQWEVVGLNGLAQGMFGEGTPAAPIQIYGDASGGADSAMTRLRRVGVAIVCTEQILPELQITGAVFGPLEGDRQVVPRGELMALYMALWTTSRYVNYTTDCEAVAQGWYEKRFAQPAGLDADLWQKIGELMRTR